MFCFRQFTRLVRREPALTALLAASFFLNLFAFTFPTWNPDYLVRYAWNARGLTQWNHGAFYYGSWHINVIKMFIIWPLLALNWVWPLMTASTIPPQTAALYAARWLAAAMGAGCVGWTWGIARRLGGGDGARAAGQCAFAAAFALATTPLLVNLAHFTTADVPSLFWGLGGLYFTLRHAEEPERRRWWMLSALMIGLSASTKYVGGLFAAGVLACVVMDVLARRLTWRAALRRLSGWMAVSFASFALASFEMWFFPQTVRENIMLNVNLNRSLAATGEIGFIGLWRHVPRALGWAWVVLAAVGIAAAPARRTARRPAAILLAALAAHYLFFGSAHYYPLRYILPFLPLLLAFAGAALAWGLEGLRGGRGTGTAAAYRLASVGLILAGVFLALRAAAAARAFTADTRLEAAAWLREHADPGDLVAYCVPWFLYFPALPEGVRPFDLTQRPPEGWEVGDALARTGVRWVMTSSFVRPAMQTEWERAFSAALESGTTPYRRAAAFQRAPSAFFDPRAVEFLDPDIVIYELRPEAVGSTITPLERKRE
ncbi:MAG: hypothetical protein Kow0059_13340 [Candidatus Sumerlaeia bacterium]